jgi:HK97 family phage prohead protease
MTDTKRKTFDAVVREVDARVLRFVISTGSRDREGDTINPRGWKLTAFKANPVILWAHDARALPIGRAVSVTVEGDRLVADAEFVPGDIYEHAETVYQMLRAGFLRATSVGFRPVKWHTRADGVDFEEQELLEFSVVPIPANPDALVVSRSANAEAVRSWLRSGTSESEIVLELADSDDEIVLELLDPIIDRAARHDTFDVDRAAVVAEIRDTVPSLLRAELARVLPQAIGDAVDHARGRVY